MARNFIASSVSDLEAAGRSTSASRTMPIATGEGVAKALIIGEATISTNYKKDTLFPTPT